MKKIILSLPVLALLLISCGKEDYKGKFHGDWLRYDGGYSFIISVTKDGLAKAQYFNPKPIRVKAAVFKEEGEKQWLHIVFKDVNYDGSYYMLAYNPEKDILEGKYFQVTQGQTYPVSFNRQ